LVLKKIDPYGVDFAISARDPFLRHFALFFEPTYWSQKIDPYGVDFSIFGF
jgi:hypothetical protein